MSRTFGEKATVEALATMADGDSPFEPGDTFHHPTHGPVVVSKVYGWQDRQQLVKEKGGYAFKDCRALILSFVRPGKKKAEKVSLMEPSRSEEDKHG